MNFYSINHYFIINNIDILITKLSFYRNLIKNKVQNIIKYFLFIFILFNTDSFASNSKKVKIPVSSKESSDNNIKSKKLKKNDIKLTHEIEEDKDQDDFFDYEELYRNSINQPEISSPEPKDNNKPQEFLSDFGIIKNTVEETKTFKKYESEDEEIFLNKDIFDAKNKIKLRKSIVSEAPPEFERFKISHRIVSDLGFSKNFGNPQNNFYDTTAVVRYFSAIQLNRDLELYGLFRFARIDNQNDIDKRLRSPNGGGSRTFENMGITISELSLKYTRKNSSLIAGKFTANFGTAWRWNKGIMIHSLASDYALTDKLGFAFITKYGDAKKIGLYNFSLSFFTNDRKNFDNGLFHRRDSHSKSQAIAGDTRKLNSYSFTTDVNFVFSEREKLNYHVGYSKLSVNKNWIDKNILIVKKQQGMVFGMNYEFPVNRDFSGEAIIEHAKIKNINGISNSSRDYLTTNFSVKYLNKYSFLIGKSSNKNHTNSTLQLKSNMSEINIGYEFSKNKYFDKLTSQIGYYQIIEDINNRNRKNKSMAILLRYFKNF